MRERFLRAAAAIVLLGALFAACGDDAGLEPGETTTTAAATTEATTTTEAPTTTASTVAPTTTASPDAGCAATGGVFVSGEGEAGICFPPDAVADGEYVIRKVDLDDPDGGLLVWTGPGAPGSKVPQPDKYDEVGVIPPYAAGVEATGHATPDDLWYHVRYGGFEGWARSAFLAPAGTAPPLPPCLAGGAGPIPGGAQGVTALEADFDGRGGDDTFTVYWDGSDWIAHLRTSYGFHAEMPTGHVGVAPGDGPEVHAALAYDFEGDGQYEAWVYDDSPAAGEIWSTFAWFNQGCTLHHVTHHDGGAVQYWTIGQTVTHVDSMSCYVNGVAHYNGAATGPNDYAGQAWEHWYEYEDGVAAEWYLIDGMEWDTAMGDSIPNGFECP